MKIRNILSRFPVKMALALAVAGLVGLPGVLFAQGKGAGAAKLIQLKPIQTVQEADVVQPGDTVVTSCPKCKGAWATIVEKPSKGTQSVSKQVLQHGCPGCESKIVTEGHGKAKVNKVIHVCKHCGSKDAFCTVLQKEPNPAAGKTDSKPADHSGQEHH